MSKTAGAAVKRRTTKHTPEQARAAKERLEARRVALWADPSDPRHGRVFCFTYWRCRCDRCSGANREAVARWRATGSTK